LQILAFFIRLTMFVRTRINLRKF